ncbi:MAG: hypothetical protein JW882_03025 [Deltaproteobacteria bacterium]|nr:hypothetical protein [Deltaproteobacteria bacterium]
MIDKTLMMLQDNAMSLPPGQKDQILREMAELMVEANVELETARGKITKEVPASEIKLIRARQDEMQKSLGGSSC